MEDKILFWEVVLWYDRSEKNNYLLKVSNWTKHKNQVWKLFKIKNEDFGASFLLNLNILHTLF